MPVSERQCFRKLQPYHPVRTQEELDVFLQTLCRNIAVADSCIPETPYDVFISEFIPETVSAIRHELPKIRGKGQLLQKTNRIAFDHPEQCGNISAARFNIKFPVEHKKAPIKAQIETPLFAGISSLGALTLFGLVGAVPGKEKTVAEESFVAHRFGREILGNVIKAYRYTVESVAHAQNNQFAYNLTRAHEEFPGIIGKMYQEKGFLSKTFHELFFPEKFQENPTSLQRQAQLDVSGSQTFKRANKLFNIEYYSRNALNVYALWDIWLRHSDEPLSNDDIAQTSAISLDTFSNLLNLRFNGKEALANHLIMDAAELLKDGKLSDALQKASAANNNLHLSKTLAQHASLFQSVAGIVRLLNEFQKAENEQSVAVKVIATSDILSGGVWAALYRHAQTMGKARMAALAANATQSAVLVATSEANNILKGTFVRTVALRTALATLNTAVSIIQFYQAYESYVDACNNPDYDPSTRAMKMESAKSFMMSAAASFASTFFFIFGGSTPIGLVLLAASLLLGVLGSLEDPQLTEAPADKK